MQPSRRKNGEEFAHSCCKTYVSELVQRTEVCVGEQIHEYVYTHTVRLSACWCVDQSSVHSRMNTAMKYFRDIGADCCLQSIPNCIAPTIRITAVTLLLTLASLLLTWVSGVRGAPLPTGRNPQVSRSWSRRIVISQRLACKQHYSMVLNLRRSTFLVPMSTGRKKTA